MYFDIGVFVKPELSSVGAPTSEPLFFLFFPLAAALLAATFGLLMILMVTRTVGARY